MHGAEGVQAFRFGAFEMDLALWWVELATGERALVSEVAPADQAGAVFLTRVVVAQSGEAWAYSLIRRLSNLYVVTGLS